MKGDLGYKRRYGFNFSLFIKLCRPERHGKAKSKLVFLLLRTLIVCFSSDAVFFLLRTDAYNDNGCSGNILRKS